ncbi:MAG: pyridoxal phosphate-dependent aminotransferase [Tissierellia bacterium]|nr:pyridoxal phosphate-dependent aminotransferase [Tissierellia bacterium]
MYNFDDLIDRRNTNCMKWDRLEELFGGTGLLPLWVADMDFSAPPAVLKAIKERTNHPIFGYNYSSDEYYQAVISWMKRRHNWKIDREWILFTPGVVPALSYSVKAYTEPDDNIIIQSPVYRPFYTTIENNGRNIITNPLIYRDGRYFMDYEDLEAKIDSKTKLLILCSPHNPVGRVWTKEELTKLGEICLKNDIIIISDEIHFDIVYKGYDHTVLANVSPEIRERCIICTAPSKTFNIAGLQISNIIIPNNELRKKYSLELEKDHIIRPNVFGEEALVAAYNESEDWLDSLLEYLEKNRDFFISFVDKNIPQLKVVKPEGTYLLWVDFSDLGMNSEELRDFLVNKCKLAVNPGEMFGKESGLFQRFNIGCPRSILEEALIRIEKAVNGRN